MCYLAYAISLVILLEQSLQIGLIVLATAQRQIVRFVDIVFIQKDEDGVIH